jgi:phospholipase/carboxylesterase
VQARAHELADFIDAARQRYGTASPIALGYSNGANIAAAVMLLRPKALAGAILLRAMVPLQHVERADGLAGKSALIVSGARDPIAPPENAARLKTMLELGGAAVDHQTLPAGHELSQADVNLARQWLETYRPALPAAS